MNAIKRMSEITLEALALANVALDDIDLFVYHQANGRILSAVGDRLGLPSERVVDVHRRTTATRPRRRSRSRWPRQSAGPPERRRACADRRVRRGLHLGRRPCGMGA